jgi:hypothetical protein
MRLLGFSTRGREMAAVPLLGKVCVSKPLQNGKSERMRGPDWGTTLHKLGKAPK